MGQPMDQNVKKLWVDALRSGEYKQGMYALRKGNDFCCLGVLCDISDKFKWVQAGINSTYFKYGNEMSSLPEEVANWASLCRFSGLITSLTQRNDNSVPFVDIANYIEENL